MTAPAVVVPPTMEAQMAVDRRSELKLRRLPVEQHGKLVGVVTRGDLEAKLGWDRMTWRRLGRRVEDAMTPNPVTVAPDEMLEAAVQLMLKHRIECIPVVEDGKIMGIITETDVFRAFADWMKRIPANVGP
ncbi:MAG: CBS domain-containing protein [Planctomycetes bacterium]|nr:CBS domain-containing protein [Planctomycetota bacterium]